MYSAAGTTTPTATISSAYTINVWNHIGLVFAYTKATVTTSITATTNGVVAGSTVDITYVIQDTPDSEGVVGGRYDGSASGEVVANYFTGFIYSLTLASESITPATVAGDCKTTGCTTGCAICPVTDGICLWECGISQFTTATDGTTCTACPTCLTPHENAWAGCRVA
jgi:hypothetical protein